jgi:hypothetical protein
VLDEGPTDATIDDAWRAAPVIAAFRSPGACTGSPLLGAGDAARSAWTVDEQADDLVPFEPAEFAAALVGDDDQDRADLEGDG